VAEGSGERGASASALRRRGGGGCGVAHPQLLHELGELVVLLFLGSSLLRWRRGKHDTVLGEDEVAPGHLVLDLALGRVAGGGRLRDASGSRLDVGGNL
jgi:hypothetical protein